MLRFSLALLTFFWSPLSHAADGSQSRAIGFSPDVRYFAFEEYGIQDGSGSAYSQIFIIDIEKDAWVKGTPIRLQGEEGEGDIDATRAKAMAHAQPLIESLKLTGTYDTIVHMPFTEVIAERSSVRFSRYYASSGNVDDYDALGSFRLSVKDVPLSAPQDCPDADIVSFAGMEVSLTNLKTNVSKTLAKDAAIPSSRWCPHGYDLEAIYAPTTQGLQKDPLVALIGVYSRGFEGSNRSFIAVPFELFE
jgi:predicted secreted protein